MNFNEKMLFELPMDLNEEEDPLTFILEKPEYQDVISQSYFEQFLKNPDCIKPTIATYYNLKKSRKEGDEEIPNFIQLLEDIDNYMDTLQQHFAFNKTPLKQDLSNLGRVPKGWTTPTYWYSVNDSVKRRTTFNSQKTYQEVKIIETNAGLFLMEQ